LILVHLDMSPVTAQLYYRLLGNDVKSIRRFVLVYGRIKYFRKKKAIYIRIVYGITIQPLFSYDILCSKKHSLLY